MIEPPIPEIQDEQNSQTVIAPEIVTEGQSPPDVADVLIVGAGASGAAVAWRLAPAGFPVVCLAQGRRLNHALYPTRYLTWAILGRPG